MKKIISLVSLLIMVLSLLLPFAVSAQEVVDPDIVNASYFQGQDNGRRASFYDTVNDRRWVFSVDGVSVGYETSVNDEDWTAWTDTSLDVTGDVKAGSFSVAYDGANVHIAVADTTVSKTIKYRMGTPWGNGTGIDWLAGVQLVHTDGYGAYKPRIAIDSLGYPWIGFSCHAGSLWGPWVKSSSTKDGTWTTNVVKELNTSLYGYWVVCPVPLMSGMAFVYQDGFTHSLKIRKYVSGSWGTEISTASICDSHQYFSAVGENNLVHITFLESTTYDITYVQYNASTNSLGGEITLYGGATSSSCPVISIDTNGSRYVVWENDPVANHLYYIKYTSSVTEWGNTTDLGVDGDGLGVSYALNMDYIQAENEIGVYYVATTAILKFLLIYGGAPGLPIPLALPASEIGDREARIHGEVIWDGNYAEFCTATLGYWSELDSGENVFVGNATTEDAFNWLVETLIPGQLYYTYFILENEIGKVYSEPVTFTTEAATSTSIPDAETLEAEASNVYMFDEWTYGFKFNGRVAWDGGLDCIYGFEYRVDGSGTWIPCIEIGDIVNTGDYFFKYKYGLIRNTPYEYRAYCKNLFGTGYGEILHSNTSGIVFPSPTPTVEIPPIPGLPLSPSTKLLIALVVTIGGMIAIAAKLKDSKAVVITVVAWGLACIIGFVIVGWYPQWVIILLAAMVGLGLLFLLIGRH